MIKADMKILPFAAYPCVEINYLGRTAIVYTTLDLLDLSTGSKQIIKMMYGKKKYRQIRDDVLNYVKQYMKEQDGKEISQ